MTAAAANALATPPGTSTALKSGDTEECGSKASTKAVTSKEAAMSSHEAPRSDSSSVEGGQTPGRMPRQAPTRITFTQPPLQSSPLNNKNVIHQPVASGNRCHDGKRNISHSEKGLLSERPSDEELTHMVGASDPGNIFKRGGLVRDGPIAVTLQAQNRPGQFREIPSDLNAGVWVAVANVPRTSAPGAIKNFFKKGRRIMWMDASQHEAQGVIYLQFGDFVTAQQTVQMLDQVLFDGVHLRVSIQPHPLQRNNEPPPPPPPPLLPPPPLVVTNGADSLGHMLYAGPRFHPMPLQDPHPLAHAMHAAQGHHAHLQAQHLMAYPPPGLLPGLDNLSMMSYHHHHHSNGFPLNSGPAVPTIGGPRLPIYDGGGSGCMEVDSHPQPPIPNMCAPAETSVFNSLKSNSNQQQQPNHRHHSEPEAGSEHSDSRFGTRRGSSADEDRSDSARSRSRSRANSTSQQDTVSRGGSVIYTDFNEAAGGGHIQRTSRRSRRPTGGGELSSRALSSAKSLDNNPVPKHKQEGGSSSTTRRGSRRSTTKRETTQSSDSLQEESDNHFCDDDRDCDRDCDREHDNMKKQLQRRGSRTANYHDDVDNHMIAGSERDGTQNFQVDEEEEGTSDDDSCRVLVSGIPEGTNVVALQNAFEEHIGNVVGVDLLTRMPDRKSNDCVVTFYRMASGRKAMGEFRVPGSGLHTSLSYENMLSLIDRFDGGLLNGSAIRVRLLEI